MHSPWFHLVIATLAAWRVAHLVAHEDGPFDVIVRLRRFAGSGTLGRLMDCPYCLSLWTAAPLAWWAADGLASGVVLWLAISGGACVLERVVASFRAAAPVIDVVPPAEEADAAARHDPPPPHIGTPH